LYEISGPLFFGAAQKAMAALEIVAGHTKAVVMVMQEVHAMDATGLVALESALESLDAHNCLAILTGVHGQPMALLRKAHLDTHKGVVFCTSVRDALAAASMHIGAPPPNVTANSQTQAS
jgi:sulfate permease, SulP family